MGVLRGPRFRRECLPPRAARCPYFSLEASQGSLVNQDCTLPHHRPKGENRGGRQGGRQASRRECPQLGWRLILSLCALEQNLKHPHILASPLLEAGGVIVVSPKSLAADSKEQMGQFCGKQTNVTCNYL